MSKDFCKDSVIQLKRPIKITPDSDKDTVSGLRKAARQEIVWSGTAHNEYISEYNRALKLPQGSLRNELLWDSRVAFDFYKIRKARASKMLVEAEKLEKALRGSK